MPKIPSRPSRYALLAILAALCPALAGDTVAQSGAGGRFNPTERLNADTIVDFPVDI